MGLTKKAARFFAGFFYVSMVLVCGALLFAREACRAGEEGDRILRLAFGRPGPCPKNGTGGSAAGTPAVPVLPAPVIRRRLPA